MQRTINRHPNQIKCAGQVGDAHLRNRLVCIKSNRSIEVPCIGTPTKAHDFKQP